MNEPHTSTALPAASEGISPIETIIDGSNDGILNENANKDKNSIPTRRDLIAGAAVKSGLLAKLWAFIIPLLVAGKKLFMLLVIALGGLAAKYLKKKPQAEQPGGGGGVSS